MFFQTLYLSSGVYNTVATQYLKFHGASSGPAQLITATSYIGKLIGGLFKASKINESESKETIIHDDPKRPKKGGITNTILPLSVHLWLMSVVLIDFISRSLSVSGVNMLGSGLFQVIYSSSIVFNALLSSYFRSKSQTTYQWISILCIVIGLSFSSIDSLFAQSKPEALESGLIITLISTLLFSCSHVLQEYIMNHPSTPVPPSMTGYYVGLYGLIATGLWIAIYTIPNWSILMIQPISESNGDIWSIIGHHLGLILGNTTRNLSFYLLLQSVGPVAVGIILALQAASVFFISSYLFCDIQPSQCLTSSKLIATTIVFLGVGSYNVITAKLKKSSNKSKTQ